MKKFFGAGVVAVLVFGLGSALHDSSSATAAVLPSGGFTVDCDNQTDFNTSLDNISWPGTDLVLTALIDDTFVITNSGTADCAFSSGTALDSDSTAIANGAPRTVTVANSGSFTLTPSGGAATTFYVDACSLSGSGFAADPWLVGSVDDFKLVGDESSTGGETSCSLAGYYLQTANISAVDTDVTDVNVGGTFVGTYDGDHYAISYYSGGRSGTYEGRDPLFATVGPGGLIKKLSLTGNIKNDSTRSSSLVEDLNGGTLSEIDSSVWIQVDDDSDAIIGGLVARSGDDEDAFIRYSKFDGQIEWINTDTANTQIEGPTIGGLIGMVRGTGTTEIRDSYSRATISYNSGHLTSDRAGTPFTDPEATVYAGGLVGSDGGNELSGGDVDENADDREHEPSELRLVRTYFAGSFSNTCVGSDADCNVDTDDHVVTGGLIGVTAGNYDDDDLIVSSFWLSTSADNAIGELARAWDAVGEVPVDLDVAPRQPLAYTTNTGTYTNSVDPAVVGLPEAAPLSATLLKSRTTYQSKEDTTTSGSPSGEEDLPIGSSTDGDPTDDDYRWAIESGNVGTFVASRNATPSDYLQRALYSDTSVEQTYRREGAGDLTVHGGSDPETVTGYPTLGRVWEICSNSNGGYPFLVWEELDCSGSGGGSSETEKTQAQEARSLGFTEDEYLRFLASGLSWEEFTLQLQAEQGTALAVTGPADQALVWGSGVIAVLFALGAFLVWVSRRERAAGRL